MRTHEVPWGGAILATAFKAGGLRPAVDRISNVVGAHVGTRNTFAKLYDVDDPDSLGSGDQWRAWLLLVALGENPADWGILDSTVPSYIDVEGLKCAIRDSNPEPADLELWRRRPLAGAGPATLIRLRGRNPRRVHGDAA